MSSTGHISTRSRRDHDAVWFDDEVYDLECGCTPRVLAEAADRAERRGAKSLHP